MTLARTDLLEAPDAELLALARAGDSEAFGVIYERHVDAARLLSYQLASTPRLADELVAEAFERMLDVVARGGGPSTAVRPWVLTAVRQVSYERLHGANGQPPAEAAPLPDPDQLLIDPAFAGLETALMARAYQSLPERSRALLWHTEVEKEAAADVAPLLGLTRNGVAAQRRRAADDLRQAYLRMHIPLITQPGCRPVAERLGAFDRRSLSARDAALVSEHLARCEGCQVVHRELSDIMASLRGVIAPLILGPAATAYLANAGHRTAVVTAGPRGQGSGTLIPAVAASTTSPGTQTDPPLAADTALLPGPGRLGHAPRSLRYSPRRSRRSRPSRRVAAAAAAGVVLVATASIALAMTLTGNDNSPASARQLAPAPSRHAVATQPTPSQSPAPEPSPSPLSPSAAPVAAPALLTASLTVSRRGSGAHVTFQVANTGSTASGPLTAVITAPAGSSFSPGGDAQLSGNQINGSAEGTAQPFSGGWSCQPTSGGAICTHSALAAGQQTQGSVSISVSSGACGQAVRLTVSGGTTAAASAAISC